MVQLIPGKDGVFDVRVGDELIFTKAMLGRYPEPADVMPLLRSRLGLTENAG